MNTRLKRMVAATIGLSLLAVTMAAPTFAAPPGGSTSKSVTVDGVETVTISAGEAVPFSLTIRNDGKQTVNNVTLRFGFDDDPDPFQNGDATPPSAFPAGITVTTSSAGCSGGSMLTCSLGSLRARSGVTVSGVIATANTATAAEIAAEAVVSVAEGGGDSGYNIDSFSDQGTISLLGFDCESVTAYRPGNSSKEVSTCDIGAVVGNEAESNGQSSKVRIPSNLSTVALSEVEEPTCSVVVSGYECVGDLVVANVTGDTTSDVVAWTIQYKLTGVSINLNKLQVYHENDEQQLTPEQDGVLIALSKKNACKSASAVNCGSASLDGDILTVVFQTAGNGSSRTLRG